MLYYIHTRYQNMLIWLYEIIHSKKKIICQHNPYEGRHLIRNHSTLKFHCSSEIHSVLDLSNKNFTDTTTLPIFNMSTECLEQRKNTLHI